MLRCLVKFCERSSIDDELKNAKNNFLESWKKIVSQLDIDYDDLVIEP
mgnify:FL=1|jgi:hypothetical protein